MRVTSEFWAKAFLRRCSDAGAFATLARRGAHDAGAIHIRAVGPDVDRLYSPAPPDFERPSPDRRWSLRLTGSKGDVDAALEREMRFDDDAWVIDVEWGEPWDLLEPFERAQTE